MPVSERLALAVWDIVKVPFPYTNRPILQRRPALLIAQQAQGGAPRLLWLLMITSASHRRWNGDVEIDDPVAAGLPAPSMIRCAKVATVEADSVAPIGRLPLVSRIAVRAHICGSLAALLHA